MKILFCAYDRPGHLATGPNAWLQRLIPDLINKYDLNIITLIFYHGERNECPTIQFFIKNNLPLETISVKNNHYVEEQTRELLKIAKTNSINLLVANLVIPAYYAAHYLKKSNISTIGVLHSNDVFYSDVIRKFISGKKQYSLNAFVAVSRYIYNKAQEANLHNTKLLTIPCGTPQPDKLTSSPTDQLEVIYAGRLETEQKQILKLTQSFIAAAQNNENLNFIIYGSGSEKENIINLIDQYSNTNQIVYGGEVTPEKIMQEMAKHHAFTLMSDYEGMPVALMEAMACGLVPVCLEEKSGINEIIQHGENGFIVKNRDKDYQEKLNFLQQNPDVWKQMSKNAIKTINVKYSSDITHRQWADLIKSFESRQSKKIKIPLRIKIKGEPLPYGDERTLPLFFRFKKKTKNIWFSTRLFIRPRARLRALLKQ